MRRRSIIVLALCLLWVAMQPSPTARTEVRSMSIGQPQIWTSLPPAVDAQTWWYATQPAPTTTTISARPPRARSGTVTAASVSPPVSYEPGSIQQLICSTFADACNAAIRVGGCESRFHPDAVNGRYRGIFQIGDMHARSWLQVTGLDYWSSWMDPAVNITFAHWLYLQNGWGPWSCRP